MGKSIPFIEESQSEKKALDFLKTHHSSLEIPIPIEDIVEIKLGMEIIPLPRLWEDFEIDGFLNSALDTITIAQFHEKNPNRYRFTLAHEIGHFVLHAEYIQDKNIEGYQDWIKFSLSKETEQAHSIMEAQANTFAGLLLVPSSKLEEAFLKEKQFLFENYPQASSIDNFKLAPYVAKNLSKYFEVSERVAQIRLERWLKANLL